MIACLGVSGIIFRDPVPPTSIESWMSLFSASFSLIWLDWVSDSNKNTLLVGLESPIESCRSALSIVLLRVVCSLLDTLLLLTIRLNCYYWMNISCNLCKFFFLVIFWMISRSLAFIPKNGWVFGYLTLLVTGSLCTMVGCVFFFLQPSVVFGLIKGIYLFLL